MRPICIKCTCEMKLERNDQLVNDIEAGGYPSTYWRCDIWECPVCHHQIASDFGSELAEHSLIDAYRDTSITFAHSPSQKIEYADQFADAPIRVDCWKGVVPA